MPDKARIEQQIRETLAAETRAIPLSNRLFSPGGLFSLLASTEDREVARSVLFQQAQIRFLELQHKEAAEFSQALEQARGALPGDVLIKLENTESA